MLKNFRKLIGGGSTDRASSSNGNNVQGSPTNSNGFNTLSKRELKAVQQAAAVAAAAAAANAHTLSSSNSSSNLENGSVSFESQNGHHQQQHQQYYHLNATRSLSPGTESKSPYNYQGQQLPPPPPPPPLHMNGHGTLQTSSGSSLSNSNLKQQQQQQYQQQMQQQLQYQQQQQNNVAAAAAAATAAAEFYEQQMKQQQHKNMELEQQFRAHLDQLKDLKDTVNNLNEMNRKLYDENSQFKERNLEQRQQIEHYHVLFQENQQKAEQSLTQIRKERDEAFQSESETKRRLQMTLDSKQQENYIALNNWKEKYECIKESEIHMSQELNTARTQLQQERNRIESLEKKYKMLEKDASLSKESWDSERAGLCEKVSEYQSQLDSVRMQVGAEKQKLEEKNAREKDEMRRQLKELEVKIEEAIKEKSQINLKYNQLVERNQELNSLYHSKESSSEKEIDEAKTRLEFYMNKCHDLEKEIVDIKESHTRDTEEWKKFQADLQTAVRVANDFMTEAEEKMNRMKDDYALTKDREAQLNEEIDRLKKKLTAQGLTSNYSKQNKENEDTSYYTNTVKSMSDAIEIPVNNVVLTPLQLNNPDNNSITNGFNKMSLNYRHNSSGQLTSLPSQDEFAQRQTNSAQIILSTPYIPSKPKTDFLSADSNNTETSVIKKTINPVKATSSSSLMDSANAFQSHFSNNSDALANLVKQYGVSKRNALIKWCQERLSSYADIEIKNFSSSWNDGLAFCALLHSFIPNKLDYEQLKLENNPKKNFQTAFKVAQTVGIQQTLNINELLNNERPDWNAVMNYVALIYKHFQGPQDEQSQTTPVSATTNISFKAQKVLSQSTGTGANMTASKTGRSSSSSPTALRHLASSVQHTLPMSLSASTTSTSSNASSFSASSSSSSISKTIN